MPEKNEHGKCSGQCDPHARPDQRLAKTDTVGSAIQYPQIEYQHRHDEKVKKNPEEEHDEILRQVSGRDAATPGCRFSCDL